ncbi:hypothetical protein OC65_11325 [Salmonella enterica]|nr:hypothetical protein [Salmonella enterica]EHK5577693.1 hypothetical protein [Salmonella enterica]
MITRSYKRTRIFTDNGRLSGEFRSSPTAQQRTLPTASEGARGDRLNYWGVKMRIQDDFMLRLNEDGHPKVAVRA